jgi:hypothetical protein
METERARRLADFDSWVGANIKGDEKGEAQVFLDRFTGRILTGGAPIEAFRNRQGSGRSGGGPAH